VRRQISQVKISRDAKGRLVGSTRRPLQQRRKNPGILLGGLSVLLLLAAGAVYLFIYHEGDTAGDNAKNLLDQYNQAVSQSPGATAEAYLLSGGVLAASASTAPSADVLPPGDEYVQPQAPDVDSKDALISLPGYDVIGKLRINKIGLELPVISKVTTKALKVSICFFGGPKPGEKGNVIITGHNYANGAHFGKLDKLVVGDTVVFDAPGGKVYTYEVYETKVVRPDDADALNDYKGDYALTLLTCASSGNRRLIVRCRLVSGLS
jgi:LPXTG-site transpeptidase (sortase) family protein